MALKLASNNLRMCGTLLLLASLMRGQLSNKDSFSSHISAFLPRFNSTMACNVPLYVDPWDLSAKMYSRQKTFNCPKGLILTYVTRSGTLRQNPKYAKYLCKYAFMRRKPRDVVNTYTQYRVLPSKGVKLSNKNPFVTTICYEKGGKPIYKNSHLIVPNFTTDKSNEERPSVFILVLESLSRLGYHRFLKKTKDALKDLGNFQELAGLTKVGKSSFPNSFAFLTGALMKSEDCENIQWWDHKYPYMWEIFKKKGYITAFVEDMAHIGLFTYYKSGWNKTPTHWHPSPFWLDMYPPGYTDDVNVYLRKKELCHPIEGKKMDIFAKQVKQFVDKMDEMNQTYFMYAFYSQATHDDFDNYPFIDNSIGQLMKSISGQLRNTVLILMGDHGTMYGAFAEYSVLGYMERNLPLFGIRVPELLHQRYPHLREYLHLNYDRLLSWFDIREMVLDVARGTYEVQLAEPQGPLSPWRSFVPDNRTCSDANISIEWCVCNGVLPALPATHYAHFPNILTRLLTNRLSDKLCNAIESISLYDIHHLLPKQHEHIALVQRISFKAQVHPGNMQIPVILERKREGIYKGWSNWYIIYVDQSNLNEIC